MTSVSRFFRIHRAQLEPWWFSSDGTGRFDLPTGTGLGACYMAEERAGCFLEVFRDWILIPEQEVAARSIAEIDLPAGVRLADCTESRAREFGMTAEIHSTSDYRITHEWAMALSKAGFAGIRYFLRHDPGQTLVGIAWFGPTGDSTPPSGQALAQEPIGADLIEEVGRRFGIRVLPAP